MRDLLLTALTPMLWGTTYIVTTEFLPPGRPFLTALFRALPVGIVLLILNKKYPTGEWWLKSFVLGTLNIGLFFALLFIAAYRLPGGVAATVGAIGPLVVMLLTWLILRETPPALAIGAGLCGIGGVALLVLGPNAALDSVGIAAALAGTCTMALGVILTKKWGSPVGLLPFTAWQLVGGGLFLIPVVLLFEPGLPVLSTRNVLGYLWLGVLNTGFAYALWFRGIQRLKPFQVSFLALLSPVVAVLVGWAFLSQGFTVRQWVGAAIILGSILVAQYAQYRRR